MAANPKPHNTEQEYLERERKAEFRSEYLNGEVFALAGGTLRHASIISDFSGELRNSLLGTAGRVLTQNMRVRVSRGGLYAYPDILAFCGQPALLDEKEDTLLNPILIVEVLSDSTRDYDLGRKFELYRAIPALQEYVTVEQSAVHITTRQRQEDGSWLLRDYVDIESDLPLFSVGANISIAKTYRNVPLIA